MSRANGAVPQTSVTDSDSLTASKDASPYWHDPASASGQTPDDLGPSPESFGRISIEDKQQSSYVGDSHWTAILENVCIRLMNLV